jgi:polyhydroxybutyrate depolymerase
LVFVLHALGTTDTFMRAYTGMDAEADTQGFIVVYPQGLATNAVSGAHCNYALLPPVTGEPDDLAFFNAMLDHFDSNLCVDGNRVFATGYSDGGYMSVQLACSMSARIEAIAPVAGEYFPSLPGDKGCPTMRAVPVT